MKINFESANCIVEWMHEKRQDQFTNICQNDHRINVQAEPSHWVYFSGVRAGFTCAALTFVGRVSAVVEALFKGLGNIFGASIFRNKCDAWVGVKQLTCSLPLAVIKLMFVMPLEILRDMIATPVCVAFDKNYANSLAAFENAFVDENSVNVESFGEEYVFDDYNFGEYNEDGNFQLDGYNQHFTDFQFDSSEENIEYITQEFTN